jgi:hypothetical protein
VESTWSPPGVYMESTWSLPGVHLEYTWSLGGVYMEFGLSRITLLLDKKWHPQDLNQRLTIIYFCRQYNHFAIPLMQNTKYIILSEMGCNVDFVGPYFLQCSFLFKKYFFISTNSRPKNLNFKCTYN